jgi:hypothetical protein
MVSSEGFCLSNNTELIVVSSAQYLSSGGPFHCEERVESVYRIKVKLKVRLSRCFN